MLNRAQTFPLAAGGSPPSPSSSQHRAEPWMSDPAPAPHPYPSERRVSYPALAPWAADPDGRRELRGAAGQKLSELERDAGFRQAVREKVLGRRWQAVVEGAMRRREGGVVVVPTLMLVLWSEEEGGQEEGGVGAEDVRRWTKGAGGVVKAMRERGAGNLALEIVYYGQLDYGLVDDAKAEGGVRS